MKGDCMEENLISVIMTTYNESAKELTEAVNSILDQTYPKFELILILDDPNNSDLKKTIEALAAVDKRIKFYINEKNRGLSRSLNRAITLATGEFIARMDADDISFPNRLAEERDLMIKNNYDLVTGSATFINESGKIIGSHEPILTDPIQIAKLLPYGSNLVHPSAFFRGSVLREFKYHCYPTAEDYDLWLRFVSHHKVIGATNKEIIKYRIRQNSMTQSNKLKMFLTSQYLRQKFVDHTLDNFDKKEYNAYLKSWGYNDAFRQEFNQVTNSFSQSLKNLRKFKFSGFKNLTPLLHKRIYRDYFKNSYQYKRQYRKLLNAEQYLS